MNLATQALACLCSALPVCPLGGSTPPRNKYKESVQGIKNSQMKTVRVPATLPDFFTWSPSVYILNRDRSLHLLPRPLHVLRNCNSSREKYPIFKDQEFHHKPIFHEKQEKYPLFPKTSDLERGLRRALEEDARGGHNLESQKRVLVRTEVILD